MTEIIPRDKRWKALAVGTLIGFCGVGIIDLLHFLISEITRDTGYLSTLFLIGIYYIVIGLPVAFMASFAIGVPLYLIINKISAMTMKTSIAMGLLMGSIFGAVNFVFFFAAWPVWMSSLDLLSTIFIGGLAGYVSFNTTKQPLAKIEIGAS
jgi:hypothetical protein